MCRWYALHLPPLFPDFLGTPCIGLLSFLTFCLTFTDQRRKNARMRGGLATAPSGFTRRLAGAAAFCKILCGSVEPLGWRCASRLPFDRLLGPDAEPGSGKRWLCPPPRRMPYYSADVMCNVAYYNRVSLAYYNRSLVKYSILRLAVPRGHNYGNTK